MDAGYHTHGHKHGHDGRSAVADKGEGQSDDRQDAQTHTNVNDDLEQEHTGNADADHPVHEVFRLDAYIDAPDNDGGQKQQHSHATQHTQFFGNGGEDEVRMLCTHGVATDHCAFVQSLTGDTAVLDIAQRPFRLPVGIRVDRGVKQHQDAVSLVVLQERPQHGDAGGQSAKAHQKPHDVHTAYIGHNNKDENVGQGNAGVRGHHNDQQEEKQGQQTQFADGQGGGKTVLVDAHELGHDDNKEDLADLCRLNVDGNQGDVQPALVAAAFNAPKVQAADKQHTEQQKKLPPFRDNIHVDQGQQYIDSNADDQSNSLNGNILGTAHGGGGTGDDHDTKNGGDDAEQQKYDVSFFQKFTHKTCNGIHGTPPSGTSYFSRISPGCKQKDTLQTEPLCDKIEKNQGKEEFHGVSDP